MKLKERLMSRKEKDLLLHCSHLEAIFQSFMDLSEDLCLTKADRNRIMADGQLGRQKVTEIARWISRVFEEGKKKR